MGVRGPRGRRGRRPLWLAGEFRPGGCPGGGGRRGRGHAAARREEPAAPCRFGFPAGRGGAASYPLHLGRHGPWDGGGLYHANLCAPAAGGPHGLREQGDSFDASLFGLASIVGSVLGGYGADRRGYGQNVVTVLVVLAFSLLLFSLLPTVGVGPTSAAVGAGVALAGWAVAGFALVPLQQHRLIRIAPDQQNGALALNACAIYAGQGFGTVLGSLILGYASLAALGGAGAACAAAALIASILSARLSAKAS